MRNGLAPFLVGAACLAALPIGCGRRAGDLAAVAHIASSVVAPATPIRLVDQARAAGLDYTFAIAGPRPATILQTIGNGCGFLDYDGDGNEDILLVGPRLALYRGDGRGHFTDVSHAAGLDTLQGRFLGCAVGDYDNDGYEDIYLSGYRTGLLLHNEPDHQGGRRFRDVTAAAGIGPQPWGTSCGFADLDGDGRLDLFVGNYVQFGPDPARYAQHCDLGVLTGCGPFSYQPEMPALFRNEGGGRFRDVSAPSGIRRSAGKNLGFAFADYDGDGRTDILVANDLMPGDLFHNDGGMRFSNRGAASGASVSPDGRPHGGMGADWADYDCDGRPDAVVATFEDEAKSIYRNVGGGAFTDETNRCGVGIPTFPWVAFGVKWADLDNDGWPDLVLANGHVYDNVDKLHTSRGSGKYRQPFQVFHNVGRGVPRGPVGFEDVSAASCGAPQIVGRGLAVGDYDNDGRIDVLVVDAEGPVLLLRNASAPAGHWLGLSLVGTGGSNRDAMGARVTLRAGGHTRVKEVETAGSYLSASDRRLLFGLGSAVRVESLTVRWPDGRQETRHGLKADRYLRLTEGVSAQSVALPHQD